MTTTRRKFLTSGALAELWGFDLYGSRPKRASLMNWSRRESAVLFGDGAGAVVLEIFHLFFVRNIHGASLTWDAVRGTRVVWAVVIIITAAQFAVTYLPSLQAILGTEPVPLADGLLIVGIGAAFFAIIEIEKQIDALLWSDFYGVTIFQFPSVTAFDPNAIKGIAPSTLAPTIFWNIWDWEPVTAATE